MKSERDHDLARRQYDALPTVKVFLPPALWVEQQTVRINAAITNSRERQRLEANPIRNARLAMVSALVDSLAYQQQRVQQVPLQVPDVVTTTPARPVDPPKPTGNRFSTKRKFKLPEDK